MKTFEEQAVEIGISKVKLKKRLLAAKSVLHKKYRDLFKKYTFDFDKKRLICENGNYALIWQNTGETTVGSVYLRTIRA